MSSESESESESSSEESEEEIELSELTESIHQAVGEGDFGLVYCLLTGGEEYLELYKTGEKEEHDYPEEWKKTKKILVSKDVIIDEPDTKENNLTSLHKSILEGHLDLVRLLLLCGADPNAKDKRGNSCLHVGLMSDTENKVPIYHLLLQNGGNFDLRNMDDRSPIDLSVIMTEESCTRLMVEYGADVSSQYDRDLLRLVKRVASIEDQDQNEYNEFQFVTHYDRHDHKMKMKSRKLHLKKQNKRNKKWESMLRVVDEDGVCVHPKVKSRVRKGVPNELRGEVWQHLLPIKKYKEDNEGLYYELLKQQTPYTKQIDLDINRTFREHKFYRKRYGEKQISLFNVLKAYSVYDREVGYCQGMSTITALLLMYMEDEEDVFWFLVTIMNDDKYELRGIFLRGFPLLMEAFFLHERILQTKMPKLNDHFVAQNCMTSMYATRWYMLFLLDILPFEISVRIWEIFFNEGKKVIFSFTFSLLKLCRDKLIKMRFDEIIPYLQHLDQVDLDTEKLVELATKNKVKQKLLRKFSQEYQIKNEEEMKRRKRRKRYTFYKK